MKALIEPDGRIAQISADEFQVAPPLAWVGCDGGVTQFHRYVAGKFVAPPAVIVPQMPDRLTVEDIATALMGKGLLTEAELDAAQGGK